MTDTELYERLMKQIKRYHPSSDLSMVENAYKLAKEAHGIQLRKSGELYIIHPLSVALILSELEMDMETIVAGILHDVVEDTEYTQAEITGMFGEDVSLLVDGVTKLEKVEYTSIEEQQANNYRKMFLAMAEDIRVVIIKIADRLHNLRTLQYMPKERQLKIAQETLDIYAPLAHRLGISKIRYELEDLSFRYQNPDAFYNLKEKIARKQSEREDYVQTVVQEVREKLEEADIKAFVEGRPKHFFSIYKKMVSQEKSLDQIYDLFAVRVIVDSVRDCYGVLCVVHTMYHPIQGRFKDYIAMPKSNMYQSLHNTLIGPSGEPFEIQIRTMDMHRTSEYGIAAHWKYKSGDSGKTDVSKEEEKLSWLRQILEWQREYTDNRDYLDALKFDLNVYKDNIYCFTPKGEVISLIMGSTPIDFAYAIHSAIGNRMVGAKVSGKIVQIDHTLETGDRVEILTSQNSKGPSRDWLNIVKTSQAKSKINQWFKREDKEDNIQKGKELLDKAAKRKGVTLSELLTAERMNQILDRYSMRDWDTVCASIGHGGMKEGQIVNRLYEEYIRKEAKSITPEEFIKTIITEETAQAKEPARKRQTKHSGIIIGDGIDIDVRFSKCCSPVPGDEIVGFITRGRGASIHRTDCVNIINLDELERHRIIEAFWQIPKQDTGDFTFRAEIQVTGQDRIGLLSEVSEVFNHENTQVKSFNARTVKDDAVFQISIVIKSKEQLDKIMKRVMSIPGVSKVDRVTT